jgi:next-to-BRCA1 protein 1
MGDTPEEEEESAKKEDVVATTNTATQVQTIADVEPTEDFAVPVAAEVLDKVKEEVEDRPPVPSPKNLGPELLYGRFLGDSIADGTLLPVGQEFTQTWYMKNTGPSSWPAGVTVKFSGGDYMFLKGDEDSLNATVTETEVPPGETAAFSVRLSATWPPGKLYISYWRLTAPDGRRFGDNIWCSINVSETSVSVAEPEEPKTKEVREDDQHSEAYSSESVVDAESVKAESVKDYKDDLETATENMVRSQASSEMVFPKLEVESPVHSLEHLPINDKAEERLPVPTSPVSNSSHKTFALSENGDAEEVDISSIEGSEGFMTDEEYDVLCASDEEFEECERV